MKVIQQGKRGWPRRIHCSECRSLLEIEPADIQGPSRDYTGDSNGDYWINCGACGWQIPISPEIKAMADRWIASQSTGGVA